MQSIERCTVCCTKLYAVRAGRTVCNMHAERYCEAMAEWVLFEVDLRIVDSMSNANYFRVLTALISESSGMASQRQCRRERLLQARYTFVMPEERSIGKVLLLN